MDRIQWLMPKERRNEQGKQSSASASVRKKGQLLFLPLFYSAVELDWQLVFSVHRQTGSFLFPSNADASGTTRLAAPVSAERLSAQIDFFFPFFFCPTRCRSVAPWQTAGFYFFFIFYFFSSPALLSLTLTRSDWARGADARCKKPRLRQIFDEVIFARLEDGSRCWHLCTFCTVCLSECVFPTPLCSHSASLSPPLQFKYKPIRERDGVGCLSA